MNNEEQLFDQEMGKLRALNNFNQEIFNLITPYHDNNGIFSFPILQSVTFENGVLSTSVTNDQFEITPISDCFKDINTLFKESFFQPYVYQDLSVILDSLDLLHPKKGLPTVLSWKTALEEVQVLLGSAHQRIVDGSEEINVAREIFPVEKFPAYYRPLHENGLTNMSMKVDCSEEGYVHTLQHLNYVLSNVFERSEDLTVLSNVIKRLELPIITFTNTNLKYYHLKMKYH